MIRAVLFDRDGTLIRDSGAGSKTVVAMPYAAKALRRIRSSGMKIGVITNQPGIAGGTISGRDLDEVHQSIEAQVGPIDGWFVCPHAAQDGCSCRKPATGLIDAATDAFGVSPRECAVVGDIGIDVQTGMSAGALTVLVPTSVTRADEIAAAPVVCRDLDDAASFILSVKGSP